MPERRSGHKVHWDQGTSEDKEAERALDRLLERELTADSAVQIALLASPRLPAELEELARLCDRIIVLRDRRKVGELPGGSDASQVMDMIAGAA